MAISAAFTKLRGVRYSVRELSLAGVAGHTGRRNRRRWILVALRRGDVIQTERKICFRTVDVAHGACLDVAHCASRRERRESHIRKIIVASAKSDDDKRSSRRVQSGPVVDTVNHEREIHRLRR